MCLITTYGKGFIAPKEITVYKELKKIGSKWITLCREWEVSLDSMLIPDKSSPEVTEHSHSCNIKGGVIHSHSKLDNIENDYKENIFCFKAIIPKGTRFWIQDDLMDVASERLYLTSEVVEKETETDLSFLFSEYCLDLLLRDGKRVKWSSDINPEDVKGIFIYDSQAVGLEIYESMFSGRILYNLPDHISEREKAEKDMKGKERTRFLRENYPDIEILKNLPEDSYIPSLGELTKALENFLSINLTRKALGLETIGYGWFWSSTTYSDEYIWYVNPLWDAWSNWCSFQWDRDYVLPFLALPK